jgi:predicted Mrr-cat superfamily restriction endonuclease
MRKVMLLLKDNPAGLPAGMKVKWGASAGPDGGIDIIAHADALGINGQQIKAQCKKWNGRQAGRPDLQQFHGALKNTMLEYISAPADSLRKLSISYVIRRHSVSRPLTWMSLLNYGLNTSHD